ncbi:MAG: amino acid adenylation domain-containing protein [Saprospiraceae bacterium]|nr:amino acid adenylation domain-containing protein [Saprospiraceae bacterium]
MQATIKEKIKNLSPDQIRKLMLAATTEKVGMDREDIEQRENISEYSLSKSQERIWFLCRLYPNSVAYNIPLAVKIKSREFNLPGLTGTLQKVVDQNEILRTTFHEKNGLPFQKVHLKWDVEIDYADERGQMISTQVDEFINREARNHGDIQFDISRLPLFNLRIVRIDFDEYLCLFNLHHLISDGWTNALLSRDLTGNSVLSGNQSLSKSQFRDYVKWEQSWLLSPDYRRQLNFWREQLKDLPDLLRFGNQLSANGDNEGGLERVIIPATLTNRVDQYCKKWNITHFQFFVACYSILLYLYTDRNEMVIGTPVANRSQRSFNETYGLFINSLPLKISVVEELDFNAFIKRTAVDLNLYLAHQNVPFSEIVAAVNPARELDSNALFNVHFAYQVFPQRNKDHVLLPIDYRTSKFDLNLWVENSGEETLLSLTYKTKVFDKRWISDFLDLYITVIENLLLNPQQKIQQLKLPKAQLSHLDGTTTELPEGSWLDLFLNTVYTDPDRKAVIDATRQKTYGELDVDSDQFAFYLRENGIEPGDTVMLRLSRGYEYIRAIIGCFKAGATYLPVDPNLPEKRLKAIVDHSDAQAIYCDSNIESGLSVHVFKPDSVNIRPSGSIRNSIAGVDSAYIIYTSGSTGVPKGVCISHKSLLNYTLAMYRRVGDTSIKSYAHVSALNADLGNTSIFISLGFGGTLLLPSEEAVRDPSVLSRYFMKHPAHGLKIVPSHLRALRDKWNEILPRKILICGGEKPGSDLIEAIRKLRPDLRIINHYGPTETTIGVLTREFPAGTNYQSSTIGKPLDNISVSIRSNSLMPKPLGAVGEICIGGIGVAEGYLKNDDLTREKFKRTNSGEILYRTGDLGFISKDGEVVFMDRMDRQVKISGHRIELSEIESVIESFPGVLSAAVFHGVSGHLQKLWAAIKIKAELDQGALRNWLLTFFNPVFLPNILVVDEIPVTANGKVDFNKLKEKAETSSRTVTSVVPRDQIELKVLEVFRSTLNHSEINIDDNFFEIGGHSLLGIKLISRINKLFNVSLEVAELFQSGTVRSLAGRVKKSGIKDSGKTLISLFENARAKNFVWIHPAGGNVMSYYPVASAMSPDFDAHAITAFEHHKRKNLSIAKLACEYRDLIRDSGIKTDFLAGWSMGALIAHQVAIEQAKDTGISPVVLIDQPIPGRGKTLLSSQERLLNYVEKIKIFTSQEVVVRYDNVGQVDLDSLYQEFKRIQLVPDEVTYREFSSFMDTLVTHNGIINDFQPSVYDGPVLLLKAADKLNLKAQNPQPEYYMDDLGWRDYCTNLTIKQVSGNHITMMTAQNVAEVVKTIKSWITSL